jgi:hypothetical protein
MNTDLNHAANANILHVLLKQLGRSKPSAFRILKLTWRELFNESLYKERIRIAQGAFAQVYTATRDRIEDGLTSKELVVLKDPTIHAVFLMSTLRFKSWSNFKKNHRCVRFWTMGLTATALCWFSSTTSAACEHGDITTHADL